MKLKPMGLICTRWHVQQLAKEYPDASEIDLSGADVVGASTMHEVMLRWPDALVTGLEGFNLEQWEWVKTSINSEEFKKNSGQS